MHGNDRDSVDEELVAEAQRLLARGMKPADVACELGLGRTTVHRIAHGLHCLQPLPLEETRTVRCPGCGWLLDGTRLPCLRCELLGGGS